MTTDQATHRHWIANMDEAPKDRPLLLWNDPDHKHPNCGYCGTLADETRCSLCLYHAHAEGLSVHPQTGPVVGRWGGGWDDRTYEEPTAGWMPDWWFLDDLTDEIALNPVAWMEVPNFAAIPEGGSP